MRPSLWVQLFGRFTVQSRGEILLQDAPHKVSELLAYLIVHRETVHPREALASTLWDRRRTRSSLKNLRHVLWRLRQGLNSVPGGAAARALRVDPKWVQFALTAQVSIDIVDFELEITGAGGPRGTAPAQSRIEKVRRAIELYRGDLLEGWYEDWCVPERERLLRIYLSALDELAEHCVGVGAYEEGIGYAERALRRDPARERAHRALMRLYLHAGDRVGALRQYQRCEAALLDELGVRPEEQTVELARAIRGSGAGPVGPRT